jgi:hypothetical protein
VLELLGIHGVFRSGGSAPCRVQPGSAQETHGLLPVPPQSHVGSLRWGQALALELVPGSDPALLYYWDLTPAS